jgi:hypothetical protein
MRKIRTESYRTPALLLERCMALNRLYEVARDLGLRNRQVAEELESLGYPVRSFASPVNDDELRKLYLKHGREWPGDTADNASDSSADS